MANKTITKKKKYILYFALFIVIVLLTLFGIFMLNGPEGKVVNIDIPVRALGPTSAPVVIEEYADFGCITCRVWHQLGVVQKIQEKYGASVRFVWHDFPVITSNSPKAAEAGLCANDQGKFWEYHDIVYENYPMISIANLKQYALGVGLDSNAFNQCLVSNKYQADVQQELKNGHSLGFRATPSFTVYGKVLVGPPSFEQLSIIIDEILLVNE